MCNSHVVYFFFKSTEGTRKVCSALIFLNLIESMPSLPLGGETLKFVVLSISKDPFLSDCKLRNLAMLGKYEKEFLSPGYQVIF